MDYLTLGFLLLAIVVAGIIVLTLRIGATASLQVRQRMLVALQQVPLFRMLRKRRVDVNGYLQDTDVAVIRDQVKACESCPSTQSCEAALQSGNEVADYSFCPNDDTIKQLQKASPPPPPQATQSDRQQAT